MSSVQHHLISLFSNHNTNSANSWTSVEQARERIAAKLESTTPLAAENQYFRLKRIYQQDYNEISALSNQHYQGRVFYRDLASAEQHMTHPRDTYTSSRHDFDDRYKDAAGDELGPFLWLEDNSAHMNAAKPFSNQLSVNHNTVLMLSRMSMYAYWGPPKSNSLPINQDNDDDDDNDDPEEWEDLDGWRRHQSYGWTGNGLRAHVFESDDSSTLVVSFKGTSLPFFNHNSKSEKSTGGQDKINDNLMFSCCCGRRGILSRPYCGCQQGKLQCNEQCVTAASHFRGSYYSAAMDIYEHIREAHPEHQVLLVGHSLGGAIASLVATTLVTTTLNTRTSEEKEEMDTEIMAFAFEAPGEALFAKRLGLLDVLRDRNTDRSQLPIWHFGHNADPIFMGTCTGVNSLCQWAGYTMQTRCHLGKRCLFDTVQGLGWLPAVKYHRAPVVIRDIFIPWATSDDSKAPFSIPVECGVESQVCEDCGEWTFT
ncbi:Alpha/Beta hydrolase protein [Syncephalis fuscata]|nr:Alpha/Beta hydrolase protein [Syncephalis fuscata]